MASLQKSSRRRSALVAYVVGLLFCGQRSGHFMDFIALESQTARVVLPRKAPALREKGRRTQLRQRDPRGGEMMANQEQRNSFSDIWQNSHKFMVFAATYIAYGSCYLARNNAAVVKVPLLALLGASVDMSQFSFNTSLPTTTMFGVLDGSFLLAYALGSFVIPAVLKTDDREPWNVTWLALGLMGAVQLGLVVTWTGMLSSFSAPLFTTAILLCVLNGAGNSVLYPSCKQLLADEYGANGSVLGVWNTCFYLFGAASTVLASFLCDKISWEAAFWGPGLSVLAIAAGGWIATRSDRGHTNREPETRAEKPEGASPNVTDRMMTLIVPPGQELRSVAFQYFVVKLIRYAFGLWLPLLLSARGNIVVVGASAALFELGSMGGSLVIGTLADRFGMATLPQLVLASTFSLSALLPLVPGVIASTNPSPLGLFALLLSLGLATGAGETLLGSVSPIYYNELDGRQTSVATAVASVNGYGSLGTVFAAIGLPLLTLSDFRCNTLAEAFFALAPLAWLATAASVVQLGIKRRKNQAR